jgi:hypothetical protein
VKRPISCLIAQDKNGSRHHCDFKCTDVESYLLHCAESDLIEVVHAIDHGAGQEATHDIKDTQSKKWQFAVVFDKGKGVLFIRSSPMASKYVELEAVQLGCSQRRLGVNIVSDTSTRVNWDGFVCDARKGSFTSIGVVPVSKNIQLEIHLRSHWKQQQIILQMQ